MRQFYLVNEIGANYFFDFRNNTLISNITDLGFSKDLTYLQYDNSYTLVKSKTAQGSLGFQIIFLKGYDGYNDFLSFFRKSSDVRLFYKYNESSKCCYVVLKSISKTELESGVLKCSVTLDMLSLWLVRESIVIHVNIDKNGKIFPFRYPFRYSVSYSGIITITNNGEVKAPLNIVITGAVNNPRVEILKNNDVVSTLYLHVQSSDCMIEINSEESNQFMTITENGYVRSIYEDQDFTCDNFLFLEQGTYQVKFSPGVVSTTTCKVTKIEGYSGH